MWNWSTQKKDRMAVLRRQKNGSAYGHGSIPNTTDGTVTYTRLAGDVTFDDVDFGYNDDKIVLHNIRLYATPGQKIAFVGSTGAGKTTITNLINRFYDIQDGKIRYGRLDATDEECIAAARLANADGFIRRLPEGYDTMLNGDGANLSQGQRQLLAIAHRLSTVRNSDCIMVLEQGRIIERGTHDQLIEAKGRYYQLYTGNAISA